MRISDWSSDVCSSDLGVGLVIADVAEIVRRLVHLVGIAQHFQYEAAAARPQRDKLFLPAQCQLAEPDLLCAFQGFAQDDIGFFGKLVGGNDIRSEEHTSELQYLMRNSYAVFCLKKKTTTNTPVTS